MGWSFKVGRLAGIDIFVHFTFLLLLGVIAVGGYVSTGSPAVAVASLLLVSAVFVIVVLHELGHALAARYYGIPTRDITLLPIGGVARLERMPEKPVQELVVALAGPAVNILLAAILFASGLVGDIGDPEGAISLGSGLAQHFFEINLFLAGFNLLPAFPMDGGRVLRALLSMRLGHTRATQLAASVGRFMAGVFLVVGIFVPGYFMLVLVAIFVWLGAGQEAAAVAGRSRLAGMPVDALMIRRFLAVAPDDTVGSVATYVRRGYQQDFPVVVDGRVIGVLTGNDLLYALSEYGPETRIFQIMRRDVPTVAPDDPLERGLAMLSEGFPLVPVVSSGRLVGLLTAENVTRYIWVHRSARRNVRSDSGHSWSRA